MNIHTIPGVILNQFFCRYRVQLVLNRLLATRAPIPGLLPHASPASSFFSRFPLFNHLRPIPPLSPFGRKMDILQLSEAPDWDKVASADEESRDERPRKKRRKYIARAWYVLDALKIREECKSAYQSSNECKRRKIKCNGETPCYRCGRQRVDCIYLENPRRDSASDPE